MDILSSPGNKHVGSAESGSEVTDRQQLEAELSNQTKRIWTGNGKKDGITVERLKTSTEHSRSPYEHRRFRRVACPNHRTLLLMAESN